MADFNELPRGPEGTIYAKENGFDPGFKIEIDPTKIEFINKLKTSKASSIFHVNYHGKPRVLKVFHNNEDRGYADDGIRDLDRARCEIRAYCRLKRSGVCDGGYVPQFYGYTLSLNPNSFAPHLDGFRRDTGLPSAVLMEYLPNPLLMNSVTYSKERMAAAVKGIQQIHSALVDHNDSYPKNIMIVPGSPERVIWIDFDIAITYPDESYLTDWGRHRIEFETACVESYGVALAEDQKQGLPPNTKFY
ncbi:serine/threonine protein kinase [Nannizzia gypsea CBS 118893]|uniref:Serine/threonine protein kinase n=1 Tax=Arthroderma gypseum (strain ATCC MYA-4604 / CBS 118893) TaxID=535722 RepID=E4V0D1_ARTGP|nr:serine/threonine protein kinase [Nannizzia gypsea CBS 118893]EFR03068.1 serine/threonine protein kinase [Nannizzia gypsea CBS 118893]